MSKFAFSVPPAGTSNSLDNAYVLKASPTTELEQHFIEKASIAPLRLRVGEQRPGILSSNRHDSPLADPTLDGQHDARGTRALHVSNLFPVHLVKGAKYRVRSRRPNVGNHIGVERGFHLAAALCCRHHDDDGVRALAEHLRGPPRPLLARGNYGHLAQAGGTNRIFLRFATRRRPQI